MGCGSPVDTMTFKLPGVLFVDGVDTCELMAMASVGLALVMVGSGGGGHSDNTFLPLARERLGSWDAPRRYHPLLEVSFPPFNVSTGCLCLGVAIIDDMFSMKC